MVKNRKGKHNGLRLCWERGIRQVVVFSDSQHALTLLQHGGGRFHVYAAVLDLILGLVGRAWRVKFENILREGNVVVDLLAKAGAGGSSRMSILESPPPAAIPLLSEDYRGTHFLRR